MNRNEYFCIVKITKMEKYLDILCVCTDYQCLRTIQDATQETHFSIHNTTTLLDAETIIEKVKPQLILCELSFAKLYGSSLFKKIRETNPHALINILLYKKDKTSIFKAMSYGIHNYLVFPIETEDCAHYINLCELIIKTRNKTNKGNSPCKNFQKTLCIDNNIENIPETVDSLLELCNKNFDQNEIRIGLEELIINAIEHGNLNITFNEKNKAILDDTFERLVQERLNNQLYKDKKVTISFYQTSQYDEWQIEDEGNGFDPSEIPTFTKLSQIQQLHGRGILISRFQFDEIEYKNDGRLVRVRRYASI